MPPLFRFVAFFWINRFRLLLPAILLPMLALTWSLSQPELYTTTTTLQMNSSAINSPVLKHITKLGNDKFLYNALLSPDLLDATARETGITLNPKNLQLNILSNQLIQIKYKSAHRTNLEKVLDTLTRNFINNMITPERTRTEKQLSALENQIQNLNIKLNESTKQLKDWRRKPLPNQKKERLEYQQQRADAEMRQERLKTQRRLVKEEYKTLLNTARGLDMPNANNSTNLLWFAEPTTVKDSTTTRDNHIHLAKQAFYAGLVIGLILTLLYRATDSSLIRDEDITMLTGLRILGRLPSLGKIRMEDGLLRVKAGLDPASFSEVSRLYRSGIGSFNGSLVFTCAQPSEGNSLISYLIAQRSAEEGKKTLFVDLNMKNMSITKQLGLVPIDWQLSQPKFLGKIDQQAKKVSQNLYVLAAPADDDTIRWLGEVTHSRKLFDVLKDSYDHIIVDITPLNITNRHNADPVLLASAADRTIFIVQAGTTPRQRVQQAVQDLQTAGSHLTGIIINDKTNPSVKEITLRFAHKLESVMPGLSNWLTHRAHRAG